MTDTTTARRELLALLLDRVERGALLPAEAPLLRPLVAAEQADADARATAAHGANEEAWGWHDRASQARGAIARVRKLHTRTTVQTIAGPQEVCSHCENDGMSYPWPCETIDALDGPSPTPDDTPTPRRGTHLCHDTDPTTLKECALDHQHTGDHADANVTWPRQPVAADALWQCAALYTEDPGGWWRCERTTGHDGPHRAAPDAEHHREWPEDKAVYVVPVDAPSEPQP